MRDNPSWVYDDYTPEDLMASSFDVDCTEECGHSARVEPDGDYDCPECDNGRLVSPLVELGLV